MKSNRMIAVTALGAGLIAIPAMHLAAQPGGAGGPVARYDMRAGTVSGVAGMSGMSMMFGGGKGGSVQHELLLRLGSANAATKGAPKADHFMPPAAKLGKSVALVTPREEREPDYLPQKPKGRMLLYWGCGENAPKGQPVVIDFARLGAGKVPPGLWTSTIIRDWGPNAQNSRTFARWPAEDGKYVKGDSSLIGAHRIASNYAPEIAFTLTRDFMAPLSVRTTNTPGGASTLRWAGIAGATGYLAVVIGGKQGANGEMGDMVMWTSSATRQFGGGLGDWLSPGQVAALVRDRTVLSPATTSCTVPVEVKRDAPDFRFGTLTAFGPEENFAYPPKPATGVWKPDWTARIRHRSTTSWMQAQGMSMGMDGASGGQQQCKPRGGLGGMLGGALGGGSGC